MAGVKISALPAVVTPALTDVLPEVQVGVTYKVTLSQIATLFGMSGGVVQPAAGGTGVASPTIHTLPVAQGAAPFNFLGPLTNGQLLIGSTGLDPVAAAISAGTGITVTNAAGSITIASAGGGITWNQIAVVGPTTMTVNNGYIANNGALVSLLLPAVSAVGDVISIAGKGAGGWRITQGAGQQVQVGPISTTLGAAGTTSSSNQWDSIQLLCVTANTIWVSLGGPQSAGLVLA